MASFNCANTESSFHVICIQPRLMPFNWEPSLGIQRENWIFVAKQFDPRLSHPRTSVSASCLIRPGTHFFSSFFSCKTHYICRSSSFFNYLGNMFDTFLFWDCHLRLQTSKGGRLIKNVVTWSIQSQYFLSVWLTLLTPASLYKKCALNHAVLEISPLWCHKGHCYSQISD